MSDEPSKLLCRPIGTFYTDKKNSYELPRQSGGQQNQGILVLNSQHNFEQALEDLEGFSHLWLLFWFHDNQSWRPKVQPPRGGVKRGLFATRSPHRPNPIGLSCVKLIKIEGLKIFIEEHDLLDQTPILDIKPYLPYADAYPEARSGWLEERPYASRTLNISPLAKEKLVWLHDQAGLDLLASITPILQQNPTPSPSNRIKRQPDNSFVLAHKTWRIQFILSEEIHLLDIKSGYTTETIHTSKRYADHQNHIEFLKYYPQDEQDLQKQF